MIYSLLVLSLFSASPSSYASNLETSTIHQKQKINLKQTFALGMVTSAFKLDHEEHDLIKCNLIEKAAFITGEKFGATKWGHKLAQATVNGIVEGAMKGFTQEAHVGHVNQAMLDEDKKRHGFTGFVESQAEKAVIKSIHHEYHSSKASKV